MEQRLSMVTLGVVDLERSRRFYERLGWRRGNASAEIVFFQLGAMILGLWPRQLLAEDARVPDRGGGFDGVTFGYNVRTRPEVDTVLAEAQQAGATILKPAQDMFWGGYSGYFADPDGHAWEVGWNPGWTIDADGGVHLRAKAKSQG
jgi:uncharacterized protein